MELEKITDHKAEVYNLETLDYNLRKLAELRSELKEITEYATKENDKITKWLEKESKTVRDEIKFREDNVINYHTRVLEKKPDKKTLSTPNGKIKARTTKATVQLEDEELVLRHLQADMQDEYIDYTPKVKWADLKGKLYIVETENGVHVTDENGTIIEGVGIKQGETTYKVEVEDDE